MKSTPIIEPFMRRLSDLRQEKQLSQRDVAASMNFPQSYLSRLENVQVDIRLSNFIDLARYLGVEVMLVPIELVPTVNTIIRSELVREDSRPRWQLASDADDDEAEF